jgi:hypothetical protein
MSKPRVALCYSGHVRYFQHTIQNHLDNLIDCNDADVFIYTSNLMTKIDTEPFAVKLAKGGKKARYKRRELVWYEMDIDDLTNQLHDAFGGMIKILKVESEKPVETKKDVRFSWKWYKEGQARKIFRANELVKDCEYDIVVRLRTDFMLNKPMVFEDMGVPENGIYTFGHADNHRHLWDGFAAGSQEHMNTYADIYHRKKPIRNTDTQKYMRIHSKHRQEEFWIQQAAYLDNKGIKKINLGSKELGFYYRIFPVPTLFGYQQKISTHDRYTLHEKYKDVIK